MLELSLAAATAAFLLVVLAEMGDKTQFVAMTFAAKYNPYKVLSAIFLGTVANFAIVIVIGQLLTEVVPLEEISLAASIAFVGSPGAPGWYTPPQQTPPGSPRARSL